MPILSAHQAHFGRMDWDGTFAPEQLQRRRSPLFKPPAAFWTSSLRDDGETAWTDYLEIMERAMPPACFVFEVTTPPKLLVLREDRDLEEAIRTFGLAKIDDDLIESFVDNDFRAAFWHRAAATYAGIHVPDGFDTDAVFSNWDCESTAWFRPGLNLSLLHIIPTAKPTMPEPFPGFNAR